MAERKTFTIGLMAAGITVMIQGLCLWITRLTNLVDAWAYTTAGLVIVIAVALFHIKEKS